MVTQPDERILMAQRHGSPGWAERIAAKGLAWLIRRCAASAPVAEASVCAMGPMGRESVLDANSWGKDGYSPMTMREL